MKFYCPICNQELLPSETVAKCIYCGSNEETELLCPNSHFQCEECRIAEPEELVLRVTRTTLSKNPFEIVNLLMHHPIFRDHGVEHHLIVAPSIIAALNNSGVITVPINRIKSSLRRTIEIPYGVCGSRGDCGACVGAGVAVSLITRATYKSDKERSLTLKATGKALLKLSEDPGPRCCKQSVYSAIESTLETLNSENLIILSTSKFSCEFKGLTDCKKEVCKYYAL